MVYISKLSDAECYTKFVHIATLDVLLDY